MKKAKQKKPQEHIIWVDDRVYAELHEYTDSFDDTHNDALRRALHPAEDYHKLQEMPQEFDSSWWTEFSHLTPPKLDKSTQTYPRLTAGAGIGPGIIARPFIDAINAINPLYPLKGPVAARKIPGPDGPDPDKSQGENSLKPFDEQMYQTKITSAEQYEIPILQAIKRAGGETTVKEINDHIEKKFKEIFTRADLQIDKHKKTPWKTMTAQARTTLKKLGMIRQTDQTMGWAITDDGAQMLDHAEYLAMYT